MSRLDEVVGPTKESVPNVERQMVNNVLRQRERREKAVHANPAGDVQPKSEDGPGFGHSVHEGVLQSNRVAYTD